MTEILSWTDIDKIKDINIKKYLYNTKDRVSTQDPWNFQEWGYWVVLDSWSEIEQELKGTYFTLQSIENGLLSFIEVVEEKFDIIEIVFLLNSDFGISILIKKEKVPIFYKEVFKTFVLLSESIN